MKMHRSRFGFRTACGRSLDSSEFVTRVRADVTCKSCRKAVK